MAWNLLLSHIGNLELMLEKYGSIMGSSMASDGPGRRRHHTAKGLAPRLANTSLDTILGEHPTSLYPYVSELVRWATKSPSSRARVRGHPEGSGRSTAFQKHYLASRRAPRQADPAAA
ncbi:hypothetical protein E4U57_000633 [Claviceps arundinis]|uniref:Uncharacterized protein n=1 Tax=Claviceps arundinis TaxID=1623583 RepID=A0A9P7MUR4_9HYPO|nr:hypothetical protein E4U57_000633 [Claviceps arundinis]KAG5970346.1 hypothetical protein E4U56_007864 [Claviceps arundinis]